MVLDLLKIGRLLKGRRSSVWLTLTRLPLPLTASQVY